jgi:Zn ribbon nucleic-acid-binding protein
MNQEKARELTEKLLNSPAGREMLGKRLNLSFEAPKPEEEKPIVAVLVPCYEMPRAEMANALALMMDATREHAVVYTGPVIRDSSVVHWTRNYLLGELIKTQKPWTHVLFIDDDIVPEPDSLVRLLAHKKDIVAAVCTRRQDPPIPNIRWWEEDKLAFREILDCSWGGLLEVGAAGTGMMLISRHAIEQVMQAYFDCLYEKEVYGCSGEVIEKHRKARIEFFDKNANAFWFRFLPGLAGCNEYGEDISFCLIARRYCGIPVFADTSIQPGHIGRYAFGIKDFLPYKDEVIARAKAAGTYRDDDAMRAARATQDYKIEVVEA